MVTIMRGFTANKPDTTFHMYLKLSFPMRQYYKMTNSEFVSKADCASVQSLMLITFYSQ